EPLSPQQATVPSSNRAHVCSAPAATCTTPVVGAHATRAAPHTITSPIDHHHLRMSRPSAPPAPVAHADGIIDNDDSSRLSSGRRPGAPECVRERGTVTATDAPSSPDGRTRLLDAAERLLDES